MRCAPPPRPGTPPLAYTCLFSLNPPPPTHIHGNRKGLAGDQFQRFQQLANLLGRGLPKPRAARDQDPVDLLNLSSSYYISRIHL